MKGDHSTVDHSTLKTNLFLKQSCYVIARPRISSLPTMKQLIRARQFLYKATVTTHSGVLEAQ